MVSQGSDWRRLSVEWGSGSGSGSVGLFSYCPYGFYLFYSLGFLFRFWKHSNHFQCTVSRLLVVKYWIILVHEPVSLNNHIQEPIFLFRLKHHIFMRWLTKSKSNFDAYIESKWQQGEFLFMEWDKKYVWCNFVASIFSTHFLLVEGPVYSRGKVFLCAV